MQYKIWDKFMIRTPELPFCYLEDYRNSGKDIYHFISENSYLDDFFKRALLVSSESIYNSYINKPKDNKKYNKMCEGLLKYFIRATSRPTPYGYFANVSLGEFGENTDLLRDKKILDIKLDSNWTNGVVRLIEDKEDTLKKLFFKFNENCYVSGNRINNPYFTNRGNLKNDDNVIRENSIRYTPLIKLIKDTCKNFISYNELFKNIKNKYGEVDNPLIFLTIKNLVENEYLFTNLRIPAYCNNVLDYIINQLLKCDLEMQISKELIVIKNLLSKYYKYEDYKILVELFELMGKIYESKNYIEINIGYIYTNNYIDKEIKNELENFVNALALISPVNSLNNELSTFKNSFKEEFGYDVEVNITDIIDSNKFNGFSKLKESAEDEGTREKNISDIIKNKIDVAIINKENVYLKKDDFSNINNSNLNLCEGFDLNLVLLKNKNSYEFILGPNYGASKQGSMFQRFSEVFIKEDFDSYNNIYQIVDSNHKDNILNIELRECLSYGRLSNIINNNRNYKYYLPIGFVGNNQQNSLSIEDLVLGLSRNDELYIKSKKFNKRIKFVKDHMLNPLNNSNLYKLLYYISNVNNIPLERLFKLDFNYSYTPRIYLENVVISLRKWFFNDIMLDYNNYDLFNKQLDFLIDKYNIDDEVYVVELDNRLIIRLNSLEDRKILYSIYRKNRSLNLSELEGRLQNSLTINKNDNILINEFVFSFILNGKIENVSSSEFNNFGSHLIEKERLFLPFQDGWIYLKIYGLGNRMNEFLSKHTYFLDKVSLDKWFFIRYFDEKGEHVRLRLKFKTHIEALEGYKEIFQWLIDMKKINLFNTFQIDTYQRELNRYGGLELIDLFEDYSHISSLIVREILNEYNLKKDKEKIYIFFIIKILYLLCGDLESMYNIIHKEEYIKIYRKDYIKRRKEYEEYVKSIIYKSCDDFLAIHEHIEKLEITLLKIKDIFNNPNLNFDYKHIISSIIHMHCNRLTGDSNYELRCNALSRHTIYDMIEKQKHFNIYNII